MRAQQNLSFEELDDGAAVRGWTFGGADAAVDDVFAVAGRRSLKLTRTTAQGITRVTQRVPAAPLRGGGSAQLVRLVGFVRTATPQVSGALWLRIDGPHGPLFVDSYGSGREPTEREPIVVAGEGDSGWRRLEIELPLPDDVDEVAFGVSLRGQGTAWYDALELTTIATDAWPAAAPAAVRYLEAALAVMREHSLRRAQVDWAMVRERALAYARGAGRPADAYLAVRYAVRELGDRHSYLQSPAVSRVLATSAVSNARTGAAATAPSGQLLGSVAHIAIPGFAGGTPAEQVEFAEELRKI
ncbi:MAG TPA: hypothetical protein VM692_08430, partial [Gammaproteobacteria bacterium]|nr:hypothetical protein [Gammaproteobacteria bacterium]